MAIERILKTKIRTTFFWDMKVKLKVHCSCGKNYSIKEKFDGQEDEYTRENTCPKCNETSLIKHFVQNYGIYCEYNTIILKNETISK